MTIDNITFIRQPEEGAAALEFSFPLTGSQTDLLENDS
jgi:hypothetical protein